MIDLTNFDEDTLFIIGNGFDMAHGIKSSYWDFRNWLIAHRYWDDVMNLEKLFPITDGGINMLWKDFEEAIGKYDPQKIHNEFFQGVDNGFSKDVQVRVAERIKPFIKKIPSYMKEWAENMEGMYSITKVYKGLEPSFKYLTFNYTLVLENLYLIPRNNVLHIHGSIHDDKIIVGHDNKKDPNEGYQYYSNVEISKRNIVELMNTNVKPIDDLISKNQDFFSSIYNVKKIVVVGHSLSRVDMPYFYKVADRVSPDCIWHFCWHTIEDLSYIKLTITNPTSFFNRFSCRMHKI
jgi:hypothetical protein